MLIGYTMFQTQIFTGLKLRVDWHQSIMTKYSVSIMLTQNHQII